jgi:hypothetical protein
MDERQNLYLSRRHLVEQAISLNEELPDVGLVEFRYYAAALAEDVKRGSRLQRLNQQALSSRVGILGDVGDGIVEHPAGLFSPDYAPAPRSHFRRMALSTSSWEMTRLAATSA